jgi:hypothetical protein
VDAPPGGQEKGQTQQLVEAAGDFGAPFGFKGNAADDSGHFDTWKQAQAGGARSGCSGWCSGFNVNSKLSHNKN